MKRLLVALALIAYGCGTPAAVPEGATLALDLHIETPHYQTSAAAVTDPSRYTPTSLRLMACNDITLTETVTVYCRYSAGDYNYADTQILPQKQTRGTLTFINIPPSEKQVILVEGMVGELKTYESTPIKATFEPRGTYTHEVTLKQVYFPPLPAPAVPVITEPMASTVTAAPNVTFLLIKGTREAKTTLRGTFDPDPGIGSPKYFDGNNAASEYTEQTSGNTIRWELTFPIPNPRDNGRTYKISFAAARQGDSLYSQEVVVLLKACGLNIPACN